MHLQEFIRRAQRLNGFLILPPLPLSQCAFCCLGRLFVTFIRIHLIGIFNTVFHCRHSLSQCPKFSRRKVFNLLSLCHALELVQFSHKIRIDLNIYIARFSFQDTIVFQNGIVHLLCLIPFSGALRFVSICI